MKGIYHGYALGADAFVANTEEEALAEFSKRAGCEVRKCVYPVRSERVYCISYNGDLFGLIRDERKHVFFGYGPAKVRLQRRNGIAKAKGVWHGVVHYMTGRDTVVRAERLVYCTFALGKWDEEVKVQFKDGDQYHVSFDNLEEPHETFDPLWTERMNEQRQVYQREFNRVVDYVRWQCGIQKNEAQDCVQDTFLWITSSKKNMPYYFIGAWMFWSKINGLHYVRDKARRCVLEDWNGWRDDKPIDIDILGMIKNDKHRDMLQMRLQGYSAQEIADKYNTTAGTVIDTIRRTIKNLRTAFAKDFAVLGVPPPQGNRGNLFT